MYCVRQIIDDLVWVGGNDRRLNLFENVYPIPGGISYNAYMITGGTTVLLDTVDKAVSGQFMENVAHVLGGRTLDYVVVSHMEPDHCAVLAELLKKHPETLVVGNAKTFQLIRRFFGLELGSRAITVEEGDTLKAGSHTLRFAMMPMVHWPEVMATYDEATGALFTADAFGTFGALPGQLFADELGFDGRWMDEARRYYTNIVGKYGAQVKASLTKLGGFDIRLLCPLHGPVWRGDIDLILEKYGKWGAYEPEEKGVLIAYGSIYGHTENAANILACRMAEEGVRHIAVYDVSVTDSSYILADAFRYSHLVFASSTYNNGIFGAMESLLLDIKAHNLQNRTVSIMQNGSWSPVSGKLMGEIVSSMKGMRILGEPVTIHSALAEGQEAGLRDLACRIAGDIKG